MAKEQEKKKEKLVMPDKLNDPEKVKDYYKKKVEKFKVK